METRGSVATACCVLGAIATLLVVDDDSGVHAVVPDGLFWSYGTWFVIAAPWTGREMDLSGDSVTLTLYTTHSDGAKADCFNGMFSIHMTLAPMTPTDWRLTLPFQFITSTGLHSAMTVSASKNISLTMLSVSQNGTRGAFPVLPVSTFCTTYYIMTSSRSGYFCILSSERDTRVNVQFHSGGAVKQYSVTYRNQTFSPGSTLDLDMDQNQAFLFEDCQNSGVDGTIDFTGSILKSNRPVGLLTGQCIDGPDIVPSAIMLPDVGSYGTRFLVVPPERKTDGFNIRVLASAARTRYKMIPGGNGDSMEGELREAGRWVQLQLQSASYVETFVTTSSPALVVRYTDLGTALWVVPREQWRSQYSWGLHSSPVDTTSSVTLLVPARQMYDVTVDGRPISEFSVIPRTEDAFPQYDIAQVRLGSKGRGHEILHTSSVQFGCYVTERHADSLAYTFPPAANLARLYSSCKTRTRHHIMLSGDTLDNDCDGRVDEEVLDQHDNDGDGRIDEDLAPEIKREGAWGEWVMEDCSVMCEAVGVTKRIRYCNNPPPSGEGAQCEGESVTETGTCDRRDVKCAKECESGTWGEQCDNDCSDSCLHGQCNATSGHCVHCEAGSRTAEDGRCTAGCPKGQYGVDCLYRCVDICESETCAADSGTCAGIPLDPYHIRLMCYDILVYMLIIPLIMVLVDRAVIQGGGALRPASKKGSTKPSRLTDPTDPTDHALTPGLSDPTDHALTPGLSDPASPQEGRRQNVQPATTRPQGQASVHSLAAGRPSALALAPGQAAVPAVAPDQAAVVPPEGSGPPSLVPTGGGLTSFFSRHIAPKAFTTGKVKADGGKDKQKDDSDSSSDDSSDDDDSEDDDDDTDDDSSD